jgi:hypothetical protein
MVGHRSPPRGLDPWTTLTYGEALRRSMPEDDVSFRALWPRVRTSARLTGPRPISYTSRRYYRSATSRGLPHHSKTPTHANAVGFLAGMLRRTGSRQRADAVLSTLDGDSAWARARARAESHVVCLEFDAALEAASAARSRRLAGGRGYRRDDDSIDNRMASLCARLGLPSEPQRSAAARSVGDSP